MAFVTGVASSSASRRTFSGSPVTGQHCTLVRTLPLSAHASLRSTSNARVMQMSSAGSDQILPMIVNQVQQQPPHLESSSNALLMPLVNKLNLLVVDIGPFTDLPTETVGLGAALIGGVLLGLAMIVIITRT